MPRQNMSRSTNSGSRIIFLTQFFDPEPAYKGSAFIKALQAHGYDIEVVTGFPNYPGGKLYDGYRMKSWRKEEQDGVKITRLALWPSHSGNKLGRIANYASFFITAFIYLSVVGYRANLIYVYTPPLTVGLAAAASRALHRCPVVIDVHDLWPDTLPATGMLSSPRLLNWIGKASSWMYRNVQFIILHTEGFRRILESRGVPVEKMQTVLGWANEYALPETAPEEVKKLTAMPGLKLLYAGNMGPAQALDAILDTALYLKQSGRTNEVSFCFMGGGVSRNELEKRSEKLGLDNVLFLPRVAPDKVGSFLDAADALLVHLRADPLFEITLPSKTQAYMFAGKPILMAVPGEAARMVEVANAGVVVNPEDPLDIADGVIALAAMSSSERATMGMRGHRYYMEILSMNSGIRKFSEIFKRFIARS